MNNLRDQDQINELRKKLYERNFESGPRNQVSPVDTKVDVSRNWNINSVSNSTSSLSEDAVVPTTDTKKAPTRKYRSYVLIGSLLIFILMAAFSTAYLMFGGNQISSDNITIAISGPTSLGGSETAALQIGVTNQNNVAIESAMLIVKYPEGARSVTEPVQDLFEERISIDVLLPGEVKNIPLQVSIFGQENQQKQIGATLEYRLVGSNGTFYKEAEPLSLQINSSPLVLNVSSVTKVAAGQKIDMVLTGKSNSSQPLKNILVTASFPQNFTYAEADPKPVFNQNVWRVDELLPEQSFTITIKGAVAGLTEENLNFNFNAGPAQINNQFIVGTVMAETRSTLTIEKPFIDVGITIMGEDTSPVIIPADQSSAEVSIAIANTLNESVYDMVVEVIPSGNAINNQSIVSRQGFYDSNRGLVRFDVTNNSDFKQIRPGDNKEVSFSVIAAPSTGTATFDLVVNVYAKRVSETNAQEQLIGTTKASAKYASQASLSSRINLLTGAFPPKVGQTTSYAATLSVEAGSNDIAGAVVTASLPTYVNWLNDYQGPGTVSYNPISKQLEWRVGTVPAGTKQELVFAVSILPSVSQVGITPILVNRQTLAASDRFTGTTLSTDAAPLNTELPREAGFEESNGRIIE